MKRRAVLAAMLLVLAACGSGAGFTPLPPVVVVSGVRFTDVTAAAGLVYEIKATFAASEVEMMSGGAAAGDYDRDGDCDLVVTRIDNPPILFRNKADGTFEDATPAVFAAALMGEKTNGCAWVDIENDGDLDLYICSVDGLRHYLFVNDGAGGFTEEAQARGAAIETVFLHYGFGIAVGDYDRDGYLDLYPGEWVTQAVQAVPTHNRLLHNRGAAMPGHFEDVTVAADASVDWSLGIHQKGTFRGAWVFSPRFVDLDGDGFPDLVMACDFQTSRILWNDTDGTFTDGTVAAGVGTDENGMGSCLGDFDGDGDLDWFVTSIYDPAETCERSPCTWLYSGNRLYRNEGGRVFSDATDAAGVRVGGWGWGTSFLDADNDLDLDLVMTNGMGLRPLFVPTIFETDPMRYWQNDGGTYTEVGATVGVTDTQQGRALVVFDFDLDGDLDMFIANNDGVPVLYRNDGGNDNDWLRVTLVGTTCNYEGIGSRIGVVPDAAAPAETMLREVDGGSNYIAQSERTAHFGLGEAAGSVDILRVSWLGGAVEEFFDIPPRRHVTVIESVGLVGDLDGDNRLTAADGPALDLAINDPVTYAATYPLVDPNQIGDVDRDGVLGAGDQAALALLLP